MQANDNNPFIEDLRREAPERIAEAPAYVKTRIASKLRRLESIASRRETVVRGHIQFLDFEHLKETIGSKWEKFRITVYEKVDLELAKLLTDGDEFLRTSEHFYLIAFGRKNYQDVRKLLEQLSRKVSQHFVGYPIQENELLNVGAVVESREDFLGTIGAIGNIHLQQAALDKARNQQEVALANRTEEVLGTLQYRPAWDREKEVIFAYHGLLRHAAERSDRRYPVTGPDGLIGDELRHHYDLMMAKRIVAQAITQHEKGIVSMVVLPISYATISHYEKFSRLLEICSYRTEILKRVLAVELIEFPPDRGLDNLKALVRELKGVCSKVMLNGRLESFQHFDVYAFAGIFGITIDMDGQERQPVEVTTQVFGVIGKRARRHGLKVLLKGVSLLEVALIARQQGIDFISGPVIGPWLRKPARMVKLDWKRIEQQAKDNKTSA